MPGMLTYGFQSRSALCLLSLLLQCVALQRVKGSDVACSWAEGMWDTTLLLCLTGFTVLSWMPPHLAFRIQCCCLHLTWESELRWMQRCAYSHATGLRQCPWKPYLCSQSWVPSEIPNLSESQRKGKESCLVHSCTTLLALAFLAFFPCPVWGNYGL